MEMKDLCGECRLLVRQRDPALECDSCSRWFHLQCNTGITKRAYDAAITKGKEIDWICLRCRATSVEYQSCYREILLRILPKSARRVKRVYPLVQRIISEPTIVLDPPNAELFDRPLQIQGSNWVIDEYSAQLLRRFRPELSCSPISVPGDGNCLFNSASILLCGTPDLALELRLRTVLELVKNKTLYTENGNTRGFSSMADYDESIIDCAQDGGYSSIWTICALSSVLRRDIVCIYPPVNGNDIPCTILDTTVHPRPARVSDLDPMKLMWTRVQDCIPWSPNHFVPLVDNYIQPTLEIQNDFTTAPLSEIGRSIEETEQEPT